MKKRLTTIDPNTYVADYRDNAIKAFGGDVEKMVNSCERNLDDGDLYELLARLDELLPPHKYDILIDESRPAAVIWFFRDYVDECDDLSPAGMRVVRYRSNEWHWINRGAFEHDDLNPERARVHPSEFDK